MLPIGVPPTLSSSFFNCIAHYYKNNFLFHCLFHSSLISKRCENEKMTVLGKDDRKKKRWWSGVFSCFGDSNVFDLDGTKKETDGKLVRKRAWSRSARKKRTVPIEMVGDAMDCEMKRRVSDGKKEIICKDQSKPEVCPDQNKKQKQQKSVSSNKTMNDDSKVSVQNMSSRCEVLSNSNSAPLQRMLVPVRNQTQLCTSDCNSPAASHHSTPEISPKKVDPDRGSTGEFDSSKLVPIITVAVILVLLFGRGFAVLCMFVYFYVVSRFKLELAENKDQINKGNEEVDLDSELHKKMVVLRGFLERGKRRPATSLGSSSS